MASEAVEEVSEGMPRLSVFVIGDGRMGSIIRELVESDANLRLAGIVGIDTKEDLRLDAPAADVAIDFSHKDMLPLVEAYVERTGAALVSGVTGYSEDELARVRALGEKVSVIHSANYSLGVAVLRRLAAQAAAALADFDIEITETHHNQKADAPSGTAKLLLDAVNPEGEYAPVYGREGMCGKRDPREIGVHALRGGTVAGTHTVHFFGHDEEVELTHRAASRRIFATGAVAAAKRLAAREAGFYTFDELMFS